MSKQRRPCTPEVIVQILRKKGIIVTIAQAKAILLAMRHLAKLTIEQTFKEDNFDKNIELLKDDEKWLELNQEPSQLMLYTG